jgi:hypothetical protein
MSETTQLNLPLLSPSQAQKHVTVNEAFSRLDGLTQMVLASRSVTMPPASATDGVSYAVPSGGVNAWAGQDGNLAIYANGGWVFATPRRGWRGFVADESAMVVHDGTAWQDGVLALSPNGAATLMKIDEFDHAIAAGTSSTTTQQIADGVMVFAVTARVVDAITGTLTSWQLGTAGAVDRFGSGLGLAQGSYARGMLSQPLTYWGAASLLLTATGGDFAGGTVRIAVHSLDLSLPGL